MKYSLGDPCRRSSEEIVARQIFLYAVHCGKLAIEQQRYAVSRHSAEFHIMTHHHYGLAVSLQISEHTLEFCLEPIIKPLCRLIHEQNIRIIQKYLCKCQPLLLSS